MAGASFPQAGAAGLAFKCPVCASALVPSEVSSPSLSAAQQRVIDTYPILIAVPFRELVAQSDIVRKSRFFVDVLTNLLGPDS